MTSTNAAVTTQYELQCTHHTIIFRNESIANKYPGGFDPFMNRYSAESNDLITVHCVTESIIVESIREFEALGFVQGEDFVVINTVECEMWRMIHSDDIERPFWFDTGTDWLKYKHCNGKVLVWYNE